MKLQNTMMQLRKVCSHPFLFDWPINPNTFEELVNTSGKMMVLDCLLRELFKHGNKVLLFSQFMTMLDIIEVCVAFSFFLQVTILNLRLFDF
jgi:ATP-dependent DNA helicase